MTRRVVVLPNNGKLLVSTDVHGNFEDFSRLRQHFFAARENGPVFWAILGDIVHAPCPSAKLRDPRLYDYEDGSVEIVEAISELVVEFPDEVFFVLGNHDWAHVGGPRTRKFYPDEVAFLESKMSLRERNQMKSLFNEALLGIVTPCGAFLSHGVPGVVLESVEELNGIDFAMGPHNERQKEILFSVLTSYGQPEQEARAFLDSVSSAGARQNFVIHGHDRDEVGFFLDGETAFCPVIFGAPRDNKRYLVLDLSAEYLNPASLREDLEILRLYGPETRN